MNNNYGYYYPYGNSISTASFTRSIPNAYYGMGAPATRATGGLLSRLFPASQASSIAGATNTATSGITFSGILNGASKTLGVINQAIPVFYQIKPIWNNAKTVFRVAKAMNSSDNSNTSFTSNINRTSNTNTSTNNSINNNTESNSYDAPTFFN